MKERYLISFSNSIGLDIDANIPVVVINNGKITKSTGVMKPGEKENTYFDITDLVNKRLEGEDKEARRPYGQNILDYAKVVKIEGDKVIEVVSEAKVNQSEGKIISLYSTEEAIRNGMVLDFKRDIGRAYGIEKYGETYILTDGRDYLDVSKATNNPEFTERYGEEIIELIGNADDTFTMLNEKKNL